MAAQRIFAELIAHHTEQAVEAFAHVYRSGVNEIFGRQTEAEHLDVVEYDRDRESDVCVCFRPLGPRLRFRRCEFHLGQLDGDGLALITSDCCARLRPSQRFRW